VSDPSDSSAPPDWAIERARAALKSGMSPSELEWRLVGLGLTRAAAAAAVNVAREHRLGTPDESKQAVTPEKKASPISAPRVEVNATKQPGAPPDTAAATGGVQESRVGKLDASPQDVSTEQKTDPISAPRLDVDVTRPPGAPAGQDWPVERARAALKTGMSVPEIERQLVGFGLSPEAATAVVNDVLQERLRTTDGAAEPSGVELILHRALSAVFGAATILIALVSDGVGIACGVGLFLVVPLAWIWFGRWRGLLLWAWRSPRDLRRPGFVLRLAGWALLDMAFLFRLYVLIVKMRYLA
jgi:hypothetical protein